LSTFFKCAEHLFFCRIERLFVVRLFRQILSKNGEKKLSTKNILYYYNYYFHVPIKKGLVVGSRTRATRPMQQTDTQCRFGTLGANCIREERNGLEKCGIFVGFLRN
jgi:hypothetical protein